jgi:deazaflavin-dependent oxidoreductase (nitroreductase family)
MWFMNKIANPFVRLILRSPLHHWMSATLLLIAYRGRKSDKRYALPVQYVQNGDSIYIVPGNPEKKTWWRNLRGGAPVRVTLRGKVLEGDGRLLDPVVDAEIMAAGLGLYLRRFPALAGLHQVRTEADGTFNAADLCRVAASVVMVRVDLKSEQSYGEEA